MFGAKISRTLQGKARKPRTWRERKRVLYTLSHTQSTLLCVSVRCFYLLPLSSRWWIRPSRTGCIWMRGRGSYCYSLDGKEMLLGWKTSSSSSRCIREWEWNNSGVLLVSDKNKWIVRAEFECAGLPLPRGTWIGSSLPWKQTFRTTLSNNKEVKLAVKIVPQKHFWSLQGIRLELTSWCRSRTHLSA